MDDFDKTIVDFKSRPSATQNLEGINLKNSIIDLDGLSLQPKIIFTLPAQIAQRRQVLPCCELNGKIYIAAASFDSSLQAVIAAHFDKPLQFFHCDPAQLKSKIAYCYSPMLKSHQPGEEQSEAIMLSKEVIHAAILCDASDIHIDPKEENTCIRFRVNGQLQHYKTVSLEQHSPLVSRIKIISGMNIAEKRAPQDGKFLYPVSDTEHIDIRCASIPCSHGEKITLRLIGLSSGKKDLASLDLGPKNQQIIEAVLKQTHGLIMIAGATGSGKTTTLYTLLRHLISQDSYNIITIENPIEYEIDEITQVEIETEEKLCFASALRSVLRHDPDIIMVGEIRDAETANIAIRASMTGHLVLSTLHANTATSVISRLKDMGVEPYLLGATLKISITQTLAKRLCQHCMERYDDIESEPIFDEYPLLKNSVYEATGCLRCSGKGYTGRIPLFEILPIDSRWARTISSGASDSELKEVMTKDKINRIFDDAVIKASQGLISFTELKRFIPGS